MPAVATAVRAVARGRLIVRGRLVPLCPQRALWNPLYVLETFLGPSLCRKVACVLIALLVVAVVVFGGPLLSAISPAVEFSLDLPSPLNYVAMSAIALLFCCVCGCLCTCVNRCRKLGQRNKKKTS